MQNVSLELSFLSLISLISFFTFLLIQKFSHLIFKGLLLDDDFNKPQAFHFNKISRSGGLASIIVFLLFIFLNNLVFSIYYFDYMMIGVSIFFVGFFEDIKLNLSPRIRLILMMLILLFFINYFSLNIYQIDIMFLKNLFKYKFVLFLFILLCFLFIINGSNLVDGFNGLLAIQLIIINSILLYLNLQNNMIEFSILIISNIIILLTFLLFNFPKAKIFMGDGGAYFFGAITSLNVIYTNNYDLNTSSFFYCIILFYLFFEVFFSFFRKIYQKKSPIRPDKNHLHMLLFKILKCKTHFKDCNYINSIIINLSYCIFVLPSLFFKENGLLCKYWFIFILVAYIIVYLKLNSFIKKKIDI